MLINLAAMGFMAILIVAIPAILLLLIGAWIFQQTENNDVINYDKFN